MQFFVLATAFLFTHNFTEAARVRSDKKCDTRCDVNSCPNPSCPAGYVLDRCNCCLVCAPREREPCNSKDVLPCGYGMKCKLLAAGRRRDSKGVCRCETEYQVCGSDGKTYSNVCKMTAASREARQKDRTEVIQAHKGPCAPSGDAGPSMVHLSSPRYKYNFIADVVEKISPAVVHIELFLSNPLLGSNVRLTSGSGFIVNDSGLIVTNAHVVTTATTEAGRPQLRVEHDGDAYDAVVRHVDRKADIATIRVNPQKKLPVLSLGRSAGLRPGEFVVAIGSPFSLLNTVTTGIVSMAQRDGKELGIMDSDVDYIQTDTIINYGNSGGPLVNLDGEVIGINTMKVTAGISFAIPSDRITRFLSEFHSKDNEDPSVKRCFLGIRMLTITKVLVQELRRQISDFPEVSSGVLVQTVLDDTPAQKGGLKDGDVIMKVNGKPVRAVEEIREVLKRVQPLLLEIRRGNDDLLYNIRPAVIMR